MFRIKFELLGEQIQLNDQKEIIIFRIIQEAFNNILKHSDCKKIHLIISYTQQNIQISIEDDGRGFLSNTTKSKQGAAGLKNMQSRTKILAGTMELQSSPGKGTKLTFKIPF